MTSPLQPENLETVTFSIDKMGKLFFFENRVFRAIHKDAISNVQELFDCGLIDELVRASLFVNTWISDVKIKGFDMVIEHERIDPWNYPYEWSFSMLRAAADCVLQSNQIALKYGYELFDVHAFNVVFKGTQPLYVDLGSIFRRDPRDGDSWSGYLNFYNSFYLPLQLYSKGYYDLPSSIHLFNGFYNAKDLYLITHPKTTLLGKRLSNLLFMGQHTFRRIAVAGHQKILDRYSGHTHLKKVLFVKKVAQNRFSNRSAQKLLNRLGRNASTSYWQDYHSDKAPETDQRFMRIAQLFREQLSDATQVLELASNQGKFAHHLLESTQIESIIATDYDRNALDENYLMHQGRDDITTLVYDFVRPNNRANTIPVKKRLRAEVVLALAVTHHLLLTQDVSIESIFEILRHHSSMYVVVEFMPLGLYAGNLETTPKVPAYYTLSWFKEKFKDYFELLHDEEIAINRHIFIGRIA